MPIYLTPVLMLVKRLQRARLHPPISRTAASQGVSSGYNAVIDHAYELPVRTRGIFSITVSSTTDATKDRILLGLALMAPVMFILPIRDGLAKHLSDTLPVFTIAWGTYCAAALWRFR